MHKIFICLGALMLIPLLIKGELTMGADITVHKGDDAILGCNYTAGMDLDLRTWYKGPTASDRIKIMETDGTSIYRETGYEHCSFIHETSLKVENTTYNDAGTYWCEIDVATLPVTDHGSLYLNVIEPLRDAETESICTLMVRTDTDTVRSLIGTETILHCSYATDCTSPTLYWYRGTMADGELILYAEPEDDYVDTDDDLYGLEGQASLQIHRVKKSDQSIYTCQVNAFGAVGETVVQVDLKVRDAHTETCSLMVRTDTDTVRSLTGTETILHCSYDTDCSSPKLYWHKGTFPDREFILYAEPETGYIDTDDDLYGLEGQASLQIHRVTKSDQSLYTCEVNAFSAQGKLVTEVDLKVTDPVEPRITKVDIVPKVGIENEDVSIKCNSTGLPPPTYGWLLNDSPLPNDERYQLSESNSKLTITNVEKSDHMTSYTCVVNSDYGSDEKSVTLEVHYQPNIPWPSCQNISSSRDFLQEGDEMTIICETRGGNPFPILKWFNDSVKMPGDYVSQPECDFDCITSNTYAWKLTKYDNTLKVICEGDHSETNKLESCEQGPFDVKYSPEVPACIGNTANVQSIEEGDHFSISCTSMDGNPSATLAWINKTDEQELDIISPNPGDSGSISLEYEWIITRADNKGEFICEATNVVQPMPLQCSLGPINVKFLTRYAELEGYTGPITRGVQLVLTCTSGSSNPHSDITFYSDRNVACCSEYEMLSDYKHSSGKFHGIVTQQNLTIDIKAEHNGMDYHCTANMDEYETAMSKLVTLEVYFPPSEPESCQTNISGYAGPVLENADLQLVCTSCSGNPAADIRWFKNAVMLSSPTNDTREPLKGAFNGKISTSELIENVTFTDHKATYSCEASSVEIFPTQRYPSETVVVEVYYAPKIMDNGYSDETVAVYETDNAELVCNVTSNPTSNITWFDQYHEPINNDSNNRIIQETKLDTFTQSVLILRIVSREDSGIYSCIATNIFGGVTFEINVDVIGIEQSSPVIGIFTVSLTVIIIIVIVSILFIIYKRNNFRRKAMKGNEADSRNLYADLQFNTTEGGEDREKHEYMGLVFPQNTTPGDEAYYANKISVQETNIDGMGRSNDDDHQEIPYHSIDFGSDITSGYFTKLVKAVVPSRDGRQILACVKILRDTRRKLPEHCLLTEAKFMKTVHKRENILEMIYCCTIEKPYCLVFEYCSCGTLKHHLITNYNSTQILVEDNTLRDLYTFALQIARGMSYLEDIQCVHRALSSNSVHVDQGNNCKITEFGMSSKVMTESTFETVTEGRLPIRWMALESILDCIYTSKTDVWSYGIVLWEIFTLGDNPYSGMSISDVITKLQQGYRLPKSVYADEQMYGMIRKCWLTEAANRPTFHQLNSFIERCYFHNKNQAAVYEDVLVEDKL